MKLIIAYTRPESLQQVKQELYQRNIYAMSITNILGAGRQKGYVEMYRGIATEVNLLKKIRLELAVPDETVKTAIEAIMTGARTGKEGDGVVFVLDVAENYRIRTGESMYACMRTHGGISLVGRCLHASKTTLPPPMQKPGLTPGFCIGGG